MRALQITVTAMLLSLSATAALAHKGHGSPEPWKACADHALNDVCAWEDTANRRYIGTCRLVGESFLCVRNRPIQTGSAAPSPAHTQTILQVATRLPLTAVPVFMTL